MLKVDSVVSEVERIAFDAGCSAHVVDSREGYVALCVLPDDEGAGWAGDLRVSWTADVVDIKLEHSGVWGKLQVTNDGAGWAKACAWLAIELAN